MPETWLAPKSPDLVWVAGADAERFLNDLISQEIGGMSSGEVRRSLLLHPDGKMDHILWVIRESDRFGLATDAGRGEDLAATLGRYVIRVDVSIEREDRDVWLVIGDGDGYDVSWIGVPRSLVIGAKPDLPVGGLADYELARIQAGEPRFGADVNDDTIPQESGLTAVAVDFGKGCFLGQELVGRIDARGGNVPRPMRRLELEGEADAGSPILAEGAEVGVVTSSVGSVGLARIKRRVAPGSEVSVASTRAVVRELR